MCWSCAEKMEKKEPPAATDGSQRELLLRIKKENPMETVATVAAFTALVLAVIGILTAFVGQLDMEQSVVRRGQALGILAGVISLVILFLC